MRNVMLSPHCSFCGRSHERVRHLLANDQDNAFICNNCIGKCASISRLISSSDDMITRLNHWIAGDGRKVMEERK